MTGPQPVDTFAGHTVLDAARRWYRAGYAVVPIKADGSKSPAVQWAAYHNRQPAPEQVGDWWAAMFPAAGVAVVCGAGSGNLEMLEIEGVAAAEGIVHEFGARAAAAGVGDVWARIIEGYAERSPKGGLHVFYRVQGEPVPGNTKLASRPARDDELTEPERRRLAESGRRATRTLIETRGQGGYVIVAPTAGTCHENGQGWVALTGAPERVITLTSEDRRALLSVARTFDVRPAAPPPSGSAQQGTTGAAWPPNHTHAPAAVGDGTRPGDQFAASTPWANILSPHGWRELFTSGRYTYWCRPGKRSGVSATTTDDGPGDPGGLYVFSTSTEFTPEVQYTKFAAYALLEHRGDMQAAARALGGVGQGNVVPLRPLAPVPSPPADSIDGRASNPPAYGPAAPAAVAAGTPDGTHVDQPAQPDQQPPSWRPVDLRTILAGRHQPPTAELLPRLDGQCLLYRGKTHSMFGESESGKSLVMQAEVARILRDTAERCGYIDYEDGPEAVVGRLVELGAPPEAIADRLDYFAPQSNPYVAHESDEFRALLSRRYALVVLDGVTDAIGQEPGGNNGDPNERVTKWARRVLDPIALYTGAAVVVIDHQGRNSESRGRFAIGAQAKMSVLTGAAYIVEPSGRTPIGRGLCGTVTLRIAKDRPSGVRPKCGPRRAEDRTQEAAQIVIDSTRPGRTIVSVNKHTTGDVASGTEAPPRPTVLMERISMHLAAVQAASGRQIEREVSGKNEYKRKALGELVAAGYARAVPLSGGPGAGSGTRYEHIRLYRAADEATDLAPEPDSGAGPAGTRSGEPVTENDQPMTENDQRPGFQDQGRTRGAPSPQPVDNPVETTPDLQGAHQARSGAHQTATVHNGQPENAPGEFGAPLGAPLADQGKPWCAPGAPLVRPFDLDQPPTGAPLPDPSVGGGSGARGSHTVGVAMADDGSWTPSAVLDRPDSSLRFAAPAAPMATPPPTVGRLTKIRPGDRVCADPACGEVISTSLPADWTTHPGCADPADQLDQQAG